MKKVVITQPMFFPWVGMLEQISLADVLVHYDDVQFSKGSFTNRVQIKTGSGPKWLTVPLKNLKLGTPINKLEFKPAGSWQGGHLALLEQSLAGSPYIDEAIQIVREVYANADNHAGALAKRSMIALSEYFGLLHGKEIVEVADLNIPGKGSRRVLDIVKAVGGDIYVTGHGAKNYLEHELFVNEGIDVQYMDYACREYPQLHGEFTPYVSGLDLVANCGKSGAEYICPRTISYEEFLNGSD